MPKGAIVPKYLKNKRKMCTGMGCCKKKFKSRSDGVLKHSQNQKRHTKQKKTYKQMLQYKKHKRKKKKNRCYNGNNDYKGIKHKLLTNNT